MVDYNPAKASDQLFKIKERLERVLASGLSDMGDPIRHEFQQYFANAEKQLLRANSQFAVQESQLADIILLRDKLGISSRAKDDMQLALDGVVNSRVQTERLKASYDFEISTTQDTIKDVKQNIQNLQDMLAIGSGWTKQQCEERDAIMDGRDTYSRKLQNQNMLLVSIRQDVANLSSKLANSESELQKCSKRRSEIEENLNRFSEEIKAKTSSKNALEENLQLIQQELLKSHEEFNNMEMEKQTVMMEVSDDQAKLFEGKTRMDELVMSYDEIFKHAQEETHEMEREMSSNQRLIGENEVISAKSVQNKHHIECLKKDIVAVEADKQNVGVLLVQEKQKFEDVEVKRVKLTVDLRKMKEVDQPSIEKECVQLQHQLSEANKQLQALSKTIDGSEKSSRTLNDLICANENSKRNLDIEKLILQKSLQDRRIQIELIMTEKENNEHTAEEETQLYYTALEELQLQDIQVREVQGRIDGDETKLKRLQNLYEAVRSERNVLSKRLIDTQDEIGSLKLKFKSMSLQIDQYKTEITCKDHEMVKMHFQHHTIEREKEAIKNEQAKVKKQIMASVQVCQNQRAEVSKLSRIIDEARLEQDRQVKEVTTVEAERNQLTVHTMERNNEIAELYDRIRSQKALIDAGQLMYKRKQTELAELQKEVNGGQVVNRKLAHKLPEIDTLKARILELDNSILQEGVRKASLTEALSRPVNVHRWRELRSSDPARYDLVTRLSDMQLQLISKTDAIIKIEGEIKEKEELYSMIRTAMSREPPSDVEQEISKYDDAYMEKTSQLALMEKELSMYRQQIDLFEREINEIKSSRSSLRRQWTSEMHEGKYA